ncbi:phage tail tape measure protein [Enterobacter cloacae complex sp. 4DZ3-17B2]|uniref:tape measure protein n=1 Tax=unclassified Enterobacter cloacae complex TaxID=2757714 RepID=UPI0010135CF0|nr:MULTISPECIES: tape measure protein [unclassified Enterobacter cloacae complex]RYA58999.1 phage tail tape measure protein [Enterobacter cloacae complex sp. 4DZ3-28B]RYA78968.1 phage tail tape measure protein [Enterobacter cloacae complex sp. 4DZ3-17B2]RYA88412.1 phage tail tape measure protein [Enterobacter cloacae complex sp. 4DZ1-17B1]RYA97944.1 phage tail tape measure protein [Enterobacter cloacae complex sp. 742-ADZ3-9B]
MANSEQVGNIVYQVQMDVAELIEAQRKVNDRLDKMGSNFDRASGSVSRFEGALNKVGVAIAAAFTIETAKRLIAIGDEMATLQARITRLSPSIDTAKETMSALSAIASQTGNSLSETERLWESLTTALKSAGATNSQILALTSTLQKIGTIGGSSSEEMANALRQFGQSIAGGTVRAEEFNSILEQMPELARQIASGLGISIGDLRKRMLEGKLTAEDALNAIQKQSQSVNEEFDKMPVNIDRAKNSLDVAFKNAINDINQAIGLTSTLAGLMQSVADNLNYYNKNVGDASRMPKLIKLQQELNSELKDGQRWYETDSVFQARRAQAAVQLKQVEGEIAHIRAKAANDAKNNQGFKTPTSGDDAATSKLVKNSERRLALAKLEGEARARLQAQYDAADAGVTDPKRIKTLQDEYAETYRLTEARKESNKTGKKTEAQSESIANKLENLRQQSELAADSTEELSREQAILRAQQSLGNSATQEQIKKAGEYAAKAWDASAAAKGVTEALKAMPLQAENKSYAESMQNLKAALNAGKIDLKEYNAATEKMALEHQNNLAKINAQATVNPVASARAEVDPVQQLVNENNQKLALMQQYQQQEQAILQQSYQKGKINYDQFVAAKAATDAQYLALKTAQENQFNEQMTAAQWQLLSQQGLGYEMLTSAVDAFSGNASNALTGLITGTMSAQDAMRSLGNTMLNSVVNALVQVGVEALKNFIIGQTLGAASTAASVGMATTTAAAWAPAAALASLASFDANSAPAMAGIASTVGLAQGLALAGARYNGGPVSAGSMYQVGERGKPEIYQASTGKQYMIPGDNGRVISNKDMQSGSGVIINNIVQNYTSATVDSQGTVNSDGSITLTTIIADLNNGGPISQGITSNFNVKRTPNGQG